MVLLHRYIEEQIQSGDCPNNGIIITETPCPGIGAITNVTTYFDYYNTIESRLLGRPKPLDITDYDSF